MPDILITITDLQAKAVRRIDPLKTPRQILQEHLAAWLTPIIAQFDLDEGRQVAQAYKAAPGATQDSIKTLLGLPL